MSLLMGCLLSGIWFHMAPTNGHTKKKGACSMDVVYAQNMIPILSSTTNVMGCHV